MSDPALFGLSERAAEVPDLRSRHAKVFRLPARQGKREAYAASFGRNVHYERDGEWREVDLSLAEERYAEWRVRDSEVEIRIGEVGAELVERNSGRGIRWLLPASPEPFSGKRHRMILRAARGAGDQDAWGEGIDWEYVTRPSGLKLEATVTAPRGPKTYRFRYQTVGRVSLSVDADGDLVDERGTFRVPRATAHKVGAILPVVYQAGPWREIGPGRVAFDFDDSVLPPEAFPYVLDPTTTFNVTVSGDDGYTVGQGTTYPPAFATANTTQSVGAYRTFKSPDYTLLLGHVQWNTATLDDAATVTGATARVQAQRSDGIGAPGGDMDNRNVTVDWHLFTPPLSSDDYTATAGTTAHAGFDLTTVPNYPTFGQIDVVLLNPAANVNKTGYTGLRWHISGGVPTGDNNFAFASFDSVEYLPPQLVVTYTLPVSDTPTPVTNVSIGSGF